MRTACDSPLDGPIVQGLAVAVLWSVAIVAGMLRQGDAGFLLAVMRPIAGVALIPAVWMLFKQFRSTTVSWLGARAPAPVRHDRIAAGFGPGPKRLMAAEVRHEGARLGPAVH